MSTIDYRWTAESIAMASTVLAQDVLAAVDHACAVPGGITPVQADRLTKLGHALKESLGPR